MEKAILITGTPCVGKTLVATLLASKIEAFYLNLTDFVVRNNLYLEKDEKRDSLVVNEEKVKIKISKLIRKSNNKYIVIDGHYAANIIPIEFVKYVFVIRRDPFELKQFMIKRGFNKQKLDENLMSEVLDICLVEALKIYPRNKICELNVTNKSPELIVSWILEVFNGNRKCEIGIVDWLGKIESEKKIDLLEF
jgi:adenylate kinase